MTASINNIHHNHGLGGHWQFSSFFFLLKACLILVKGGKIDVRLGFLNTNHSFKYELKFLWLSF